MSGLYTWIRTIAGFLILSTFLRELLPDRRFEPFLRNLLGILLILVVLQPVLTAGGLNSWLETRISRWEDTWESLKNAEVYAADWDELQAEFWEGEAELQVKQELQTIVEEHDLEMLDCDLNVEGENISAQLRVRDTAGRREEAVSDAVQDIKTEIRETFSLNEVMVEVES